MILTKEKRGLIVALFVMLVLVSVLFSAVGNCIAYAEDTNAFDNTNILEDLTTSTVAGKAFDINDYPYDNTVDDKHALQVLNFVEYCYGYYANLRGNFALYVYLYNPKALDIVNGSESNKIEIAVGKNADGNEAYEKFNLRYCSKTDDKLFYKFKVVDHKCAVDGKTIVERVDSAKRVYSVAGFEIFTYGSRTATDYTVGGIYEFSGYVAGYGQNENAASTLQSTVQDLETIQLDLHSTVYRPVGTGTANGQYSHYTQNQLNTVYFSLNNEYMKKYGDISGIKASFYEYKTSPIVVTDNKAVYDELSKFVGKKLVENNADWGHRKNMTYDQNCKFSLYDAFSYYGSSVSPTPGKEDIYSQFFFPYNYPNKTLEKFIEKQLPYLFYTGNHTKDGSVPTAKNFNLPEEAILDYIYKYDKSFENGKLNIKNGISKDLFLGKVDNGHTEGYQVINKPATDKYQIMSFVESTPWYKTLFSFGLHREYSNKGYDNVKAILPISIDNFNSDPGSICDSLLIGAEDYNDVFESCKTAEFKNETVYLFRFAQSNYTARRLATSGALNLNFEHAYMAEETVYLDFDIIDLTFCKDGVYKTIPVVSNPIDVVGSATAPVQHDDWATRMKAAFDELWQQIKAFFKDAWKYIVIAIAVLAGIVLIVLVIKAIYNSYKDNRLARNIGKSINMQAYRPTVRKVRKVASKSGRKRKR